jgi:hypothetical protein
VLGLGSGSINFDHHLGISGFISLLGPFSEEANVDSHLAISCVSLDSHLVSGSSVIVHSCTEQVLRYLANMFLAFMLA